MILAHPRRHKRSQRQPKQEMKIRPEDSAVDVLNNLQQVMMVAPVDADKNEAEDVAQKDRRQRTQSREARSDGHAQLKHHDRDDDRDHSIAECFEAVAGHDSANLSMTNLMANSINLESVLPFPISSPQLIWHLDQIFSR